jgi:outer membrane protein TolC
LEPNVSVAERQASGSPIQATDWIASASTPAPAPSVPNRVTVPVVQHVQFVETPDAPPAYAEEFDSSGPRTAQMDHAAAGPPVIPVDLVWALEIAAGENPEIGFARQQVQQSYARVQQAGVLWLPSLRAGVNYNKHDGVIQDVQGNMISNSRASLYTGLGAQAVGAGSPAVPGLLMNFHLRDAIFQPRIAEQSLGASLSARRATTNDTLLETALAYMDLLEAVQALAVAEETLGNTEQLSELTASFAESGQGLESDADRAEAELALRQIEVLRSSEDVRVASVRLSQLLSRRDHSVTLVPQEPALVPIEMVQLNNDPCQVSELIAMGLSNRPELTESRYLVGEAVQRLRREKYAPLVPSVLLGASYGGNGGSPSGDIDDFDDRFDFDAVAYWEIRNLGLGERYSRDDARSGMEQARWRQVRVMDQIASEVAEAHAQVESRRMQIDLAQAGIQSAEASYRRNSERIRDSQGLPIETLQAIQALDQARRQYVRVVADYNRAQFRLHRALGWPNGTGMPCP